MGAVVDEKPHQLLLLGAQNKAAAAAGQGGGGREQRQIPVGQGVGDDLGGPSQNRAQAGQKLLVLKRFRQIVVGPGVQPADPVGQLGFRGEHQHRHSHVGGAEGAENLVAVHAGEHHVQDEGVVNAAFRQLQPFLAVVDAVGAVTVIFQDVHEGGRQPLFVLDDQYSHSKNLLRSDIFCSEYMIPHLNEAENSKK